MVSTPTIHTVIRTLRSWTGVEEEVQVDWHREGNIPMIFYKTLRKQWRKTKFLFGNLVCYVAHLSSTVMGDETEGWKMGCQRRIGSKSMGSTPRAMQDPCVSNGGHKKYVLRDHLLSLPFCDCAARM
eukprot:gene15106-biopygen8349